MTNTTGAEMLEALRLADEYAEARHQCGTHLYNAKTEAARPAMPETWHVVAHINGEAVLSIGYNWVSGRELAPEEEQAIIGMAQHLLSFVGYGLPPSDFDPDDAAPQAQQPGATYTHADVARAHADGYKLGMSQVGTATTGAAPAVVAPAPVVADAVSVPEGWKVVPVERSYDQRAKALIAFNTTEAKKGCDRDDALQAAWEATLAAAPQAPAGKQDGGAEGANA